MKEYFINSWNEFMSAVLEISFENKGFCWYRGHRETGWKLLPSVKRDPFNQGENEQYLANNFYIDASRRIRDKPNNKAGWISLMQHYGLPTRLLDWSESPLIALFFALENQEGYSEKDAIVWSLNPEKLNINMDNDKYLYPMDSYTVQKYIEPAFSKCTEPDNVIACFPVENDLRMYVQQSAFTIHSSNLPLEEFKCSVDFLNKIVISSKIKKEFKLQLEICGFKLSNIYPDVEHISKELKNNF
ncbi:MAG: FRG domain-containing protein [Paenibacillaceae bacterium]|nr:FRG domain-containing protein [Paenibacillaceae bacterium]